MDTKLLAAIPLFSKLDENDLAALAGMLREKQFGANEPVFWIGDKGDNLYVIHHGRVQVSFPDETGKEQTLAVLEDGAFFGDLSLLDGGVRTASIRTIDATTCFALSRADFITFLEQHPHASVNVLSVLGSRQRDILTKLRGVTNANQVIEQRATTWQKIADFIAEVSASKAFVVFHLILFAGWMLWNKVAVSWQLAFDPFPFNFLTMTVSLEAIFLSIFVLISQNRSGEKDRIRADADYQVNLKAQHEIMQLHGKLDKLAEAIAEHRK